MQRIQQNLYVLQWKKESYNMSRRRIKNSTYYGYLCFLFLFSLAQNVQSQKVSTLRVVDSLKLMLPEESGNERLRILHNISMYLRNLDVKESLQYGRRMLKEAALNPDTRLKAKSYCLMAEIFDHAGVSTDSIKVLAERCIELGNIVGHNTSLANGNYRLGNYYKMKAEYEQAIEYYIKTIALSEEHNHPRLKANSLHGIGVIKDYQKKYDEAIKYFGQSAEIGIETDDDDVLFNSYQSSAISKFRKGNQAEGLLDFFKAKNHAITVIQEMNILSNISYAHTSENRMDSAEYYIVEAKKLSDEYGSARQKIASYSALIGFHIKLKEWDKAFPVLQAREKLIQERQSKKWLRTNAEDFSKYYNSKGDYKKALVYKDEFITYNDSILNEKNQFAIKELEQKYETEKKEILIAEQKKKIQNKNRQRNLFLVIGLLSIGFLLQRMWKNKQIARQQKIINQKEIDKLKKENTIMNLSSILEGQYSERKRIAQDLHDGLGGLLSSAKIQLQNVKLELDKLDEMSIFANAENLIDNAYQEVRRISHDMMPGALVKLGLLAAVEDLAEQLNESGKLIVQTQWFTSDDDMDEKTKISLYRIIQEATTNTLKYANAEKLFIQLSRNNNLYQLTIEDDGKGFDNTKGITEGIGLKSIKSRVDYLNGEYELISGEGKGVSIEISVPA